MNTQLLDQTRRLSLDEQIEFVEALWDDLANRAAVPRPTEAQRAELDRRLDDHLAYPEDGMAWDAVKAAALARIGRGK